MLRSTGKSSISAPIKEAANVQKVFARQQKYSSVLILEEPTTVVYLRKAFTLAVDSDHASHLLLTSSICHLNLISKLSTVDMIALEAKRHLSQLSSSAI